MKKILFLITLVGSVCFINAQDYISIDEEEPGKKYNAFYMVQTGMNISKFNQTETADGAIVGDYYNMNGLCVSFMSEVETKSPYFYKQFGIRYSEMGSAYTTDKNNSVKLKYITLPLLFNFKIGSPTFKVFAGFGGYAGLAFASSLKEDGEVVSENILGWQYESDGDGDDGRLYQYGDAGLLFGGGFQYILPNKDGIQLSCHYGLGLVPISNGVPLVAGAEETFNPKEKNVFLNFSIAYMFGKVREVSSL